jgi:hypothetical protein
VCVKVVTFFDIKQIYIFLKETNYTKHTYFTYTRPVRYLRSITVLRFTENPYSYCPYFTVVKFRNVQPKQRLVQSGMECVCGQLYAYKSVCIRNRNPKLMEHDRPQHDRFIAQQYYSVTFIFWVFHFLQNKFGALLKMLLHQGSFAS